jgi:hypothetical protein
MERCDAGLSIVGSGVHENANAPHPLGRRLRPSRQRPRDSRAAEKRDELASFQLIEAHSVPVSQGRIAGYRIGEDQSAGITGILQPVSRPRSAMGQNEKVSQRAFLDRCTPESRHCSARLARQKSATTGLMHRSKSHCYSITSSAVARRVDGTSRASDLAVLRLITSSNFVGC